MRFLIVFLTLLMPAAAMAELLVESAWSRATVPGARSGVVYATLTNPGDNPVTITGVESELAHHVMVHETVMVDDMMQMRHRDAVTVAAGETVLLEPGGLHIMLMGLSSQLREGENFGVTLVTGDDDRFEVNVRVGAIGQMEAPAK